MLLEDNPSCLKSLWNPSTNCHPSTTGTHNHCTLLKWEKTKVDNIDSTDIWIYREEKNQITRVLTLCIRIQKPYFLWKQEVTGVKLESDYMETYS